jgi:hypothetical protein
MQSELLQIGTQCLKVELVPECWLEHKDFQILPELGPPLSV